LHDKGIIFCICTSICTTLSYLVIIPKLNELNYSLKVMTTWSKYTNSVFSGKSMILLVIGGLVAGGILAILK